ncbi:pilin [Actinomadura macra]|uniref:pilin n=1 Tax=Actinomadura macra TaxID=46164 RepID=UPI000A4629D6|nr:pilin [Actinomadura macra]
MHTNRTRPRLNDRRPEQSGNWTALGPSTATPPVRRRHSCRRLLAASLSWSAGCSATALLVPGVAEAGTNLAAAASLDEVITNLRNVITGLLVGLATLFATIGGVRYMLAGGDPGEVEAAKKTLRYAAIGYSVAVLAPVLVKLLQSIVGEPS